MRNPPIWYVFIEILQFFVENDFILPYQAARQVWKGTVKERRRSGKGTFARYEKKEWERNAFLKIGNGTGTERVPHFTKISNALLNRQKNIIYDRKNINKYWVENSNREQSIRRPLFCIFFMNGHFISLGYFVNRSVCSLRLHFRFFSNIFSKHGLPII